MCHFEMISLIFLDEQGESTLKQGKRKTKGKARLPLYIYLQSSVLLLTFGLGLCSENEGGILFT